MKITREPEQFRPITITLDNRDEAWALFEIVDRVAVTNRTDPRIVAVKNALLAELVRVGR